MSDEIEIKEMREEDWVSPEDLRLRALEQARLRAEQEEADRLSGRFSSSSSASSRGAGSKSSSSSSLFPSSGVAQWSTVLSDSVLCSSSVLAALVVLSFLGTPWSPAFFSLLVAAAGFGVVAMASFCGCLRFAGVGPLVPAHDFLSEFAGMTAMPLLGWAALLAGEVHLSSRAFHLGLPLVLAVAGSLIARGGGGKGLGNLVSTLGGVAVGVRAVIAIAVWRAPATGAVLATGVAAAVAAGHFIDDRRKMARHGPTRMLGVDVFHYLFALAMLLMGVGIRMASEETPSPLLLAYFVR